MNDERPTLDYQPVDPNDRERKVDQKAFEFVIGAFGTIVAVISALPAFAGHDPLVIVLMMTPCLGWIGFIAHAGFNSSRRAMVIGAATSLGIFLLLLGICALQPMRG